jgi:hypothetical protein
MRMDLMEQAAACLEKAAECERRALLVEDDTHRRTDLELARLWREMAEHGERLNEFFGRRQAEREDQKRSLKK